MTVAHPDADALARFSSVIADELNVKDVQLTTDVASAGTFQLEVVPKALGPRVGGQVQQVIKAVKAGDWSTDPATGRPVAAGVLLEEGEYTMRLQAADADASAALPGNVGVVSLDLAVTDALREEGMARDVIRVVQQARRDAGLQVSDRIALVISGPDEVIDAVRTHRDLVAGEVLATVVELQPADAPPAGGVAAEVGDDLAITVRVTKA